MVQRGTGDFEITEGQNVVISGTITVPEDFSKELLYYPELSKTSNTSLSADEFYNELHNRGYDFSGLFKSVRGVETQNEGKHFNFSKLS